jgi:drug/metabolite transporter (DMT)-like permease
VATHTYANPVVAVILGWLLAREPFSLRVVLASVAILGAIMLIRRGERAVAVKRPETVALAAEIQTSEECA